jgi:hypothetical protein
MHGVKECNRNDAEMKKKVGTGDTCSKNKLVMTTASN